MKKFAIVLAIGLMLCAFSTANATLLNLQLGLPDIFSDTTGTYSYNATSDLFRSDATAQTITFDGTTSIPITGGSYSVQFHVDSAGNLTGGVVGDDLLITGSFTYNSVFYSGTLVAGEVTQFGWQDMGNYFVFDFIFNFTSGALSQFYGNGNIPGGDVAFSELSAFNNDWTVNHSGTKTKHDTAPVPEPATMLLLGSGLIGLAGFARRRFKK